MSLNNRLVTSLKVEFFQKRVIALADSSITGAKWSQRSGSKESGATLLAQCCQTACSGTKKHSRLQRLIVTCSIVEEEEWVEVSRNNESTVRKQIRNLCWKFAKRANVHLASDTTPLYPTTPFSSH